MPRTWANGVSLCSLGAALLTISRARMPRTSSASATSERWHRHGTASAHISAVGRASANLIARSSASSELGRLHVVRVAPKARVAPAQIDGIWLSSAKPAKLFQMKISNARGAQRFCQRVAIELRVVPRFRDRAYVDQLLDAIRAQQLNEFVDRPRRMPDGKDWRMDRFFASGHTTRIH